MILVFMGSGDFALPILQRLSLSHHHVSLVITAPDKPAGRGLVVKTSSLKKYSLEKGFKLLQPEKINEQANIKILQSHNPDLIVVASFGQKLSEKILKIPKYFCINVHPSLLPKYRGAAPVQWAILNGEEFTGVSIYKMTEHIDAGPLLACWKIKIPPKITAGALERKLAEVGGELLIDLLENIEKGKLNESPQDESKATYAPKIPKEFSRIKWDKDAIYIRNIIMALSPKPLAHTYLELGTKTIRINIFDVDIDPDIKGKAGVILAISKDFITVGCQTGAVLLRRLQPENRRIMSALDFINGYRIKPGQRFI